MPWCHFFGCLAQKAEQNQSLAVPLISGLYHKLESGAERGDQAAICETVSLPSFAGADNASDRSRTLCQRVPRLISSLTISLPTWEAIRRSVASRRRLDAAHVVRLCARDPGGNRCRRPTSRPARVRCRRAGGHRIPLVDTGIDAALRRPNEGLFDIGDSPEVLGELLSVGERLSLKERLESGSSLQSRRIQHGASQADMDEKQHRKRCWENATTFYAFAVAE